MSYTSFANYERAYGTDTCVNKGCAQNIYDVLGPYNPQQKQVQCIQMPDGLTCLKGVGTSGVLESFTPDEPQHQFVRRDQQQQDVEGFYNLYNKSSTPCAYTSATEYLDFLAVNTTDSNGKTVIGSSQGLPVCTPADQSVIVPYYPPVFGTNAGLGFSTFLANPSNRLGGPDTMARQPGKFGMNYQYSKSGSHDHKLQQRSDCRM